MVQAGGQRKRAATVFCSATTATAGAPRQTPRLRLRLRLRLPYPALDWQLRPG